jgi:uracil-DNA glycosylase
LRNCAPYLEEELSILRPWAVLALGAIGFHAYLRLLLKQGRIDSVGSYRFSHGAEFKLPGDLPGLFASYHPSQQNTQTGKLTPAMFSAVLRPIRAMLGGMEEKNPRR